jgi:hypothetical protein
MIVDDKGRVLIGTGGERGRIYRIDKPGDKPKPIFEADGVQYIWAIRQTPDGALYAATGPNGQLFEIKPDGSHKIVFDSDENNLLSLAGDGKDLLFVGTDPNGHVYRVNRKTGESFVVYDAAESEVTALAMDAKGNLYAGTAQSTGQEGPEAEEPGASEKVGRPEQQEGTGAGPIPSEPPKAPEPPKMPLPGPGDPQPIPKSATSKPSNGRASALPTLKPAIYLSAAPGDEPGGDPGEPSPKPGPKPTPGPGKKPKQPPVAAAARRAAAAIQNQQVNPRAAGQPAEGGNAVYKIDPQGFVTEIFRQPVLVLSLYERDGVLLVGTGSDGLVYQINPGAEETVVVAKVDAKEVLSLLPTRDGGIFMGMANDGQISSMSSGYAARGTFLSPVLDATQISKFGKLHLRGTLPGGTSLTVATRSSNVGEESEEGWSPWTSEVPASQWLPITSPVARFFQYRLTFTSEGGKQTPVVDEVSVSYQMPNLPPQIKSIKITSAGGGSPGANAAANAAAEIAAAGNGGNGASAASPDVNIAWEATDPNGDTLRYTLCYRAAGSESWIQLKDKLTEGSYEWNTRSVADGRYEIKVVASDSSANPVGEGKTASRISDPIEVDNTPPDIGDLKVEAQEKTAHVVARIVDQSSTVAQLEYAVDSASDWQAILPSDSIADSPDEAYDFVASGLSDGPHQITLRATDAHGNQSYHTVTVTIGQDRRK